MRTCAFVLAVVGGVLCIGAASRAAESPTVSPEPYFKHADYRQIRLSPSGRYLGAIVPVQGRAHLAVIDLDSRKSQVIAGVDNGDVGWFEWVNDDRLVFSAIDLQSGLGETIGGGLFAVGRDGTDDRVLVQTAATQFGRGQAIYRYAVFLDRVDDGSADILVWANEHSAKYPDAYRVDTRTGRKTLLTHDKPGNPVRWIADRKGAIRAAITDEKSIRQRSWWRAAPDAKWELIGEYANRDHRIDPVAFDGDGSLIVASNLNRDTFALYRYDPEAKKLGELLAAHPRIDLDKGLIYDRRKQRVVGVRYVAERPGIAWFDDDWARLAKGIDQALPGMFNDISRSLGSRVLVTSQSDRLPAQWHLLDVEKRQMEFIAAQRKGIVPEMQPARQFVGYAARDGLEIPAVLTTPKGKEAKNLPLVVLVHGGPWVRGSDWRWDDEAAYLAALGYAVLQPEFRGSTGFGKQHFEKSWKQWGLAMQDDLNDGVDWLVKQGVADPKRVCIMGASYGGYAVMQGLARDPDRWRCGINYVGVTDLGLHFGVTWSDFAYSEWIENAAKEWIGDPTADAAQFKATSPLANAARIKAPVLMVYGGGDRRVPIIHGESMRDALRKNGTPVEWVAYQEEGHGFLLEKNRFDFYDRVAKFLAQHLGGP